MTTEVIFVNTVLGQGALNGVVNLQLGTFLFTPNVEGEVELDPVVTCRLRMDKQCAVNLHESLGALLEALNEAEAAKSE